VQTGGGGSHQSGAFLSLISGYAPAAERFLKEVNSRPAPALAAHALMDFAEQQTKGGEDGHIGKNSQDAS